MIALIALVASLVAGDVPDPRSASPDGSDLLRACSAAIKQAEGAEVSTTETLEAIYCIGYVGGILDGLAILNWRGGATPVCLPERGVDNEQAIRIIVKHLRDNPAELHNTARVSVLVAIGEAFKC